MAGPTCKLIAAECSVTLVIDPSRASFADDSFGGNSTSTSDFSYVYLADIFAVKLVLASRRAGASAAQLRDLVNGFSSIRASLVPTEVPGDDTAQQPSDASLLWADACDGVVEIAHLTDWHVVEPPEGVKASPKAERNLSLRCCGRYSWPQRKRLVVSLTDPQRTNERQRIDTLLETANRSGHQPSASVTVAKDIILMSSIAVDQQVTDIPGATLVTVSVENTRVNVPVVIWQPYLHLGSSSTGTTAVAPHFEDLFHVTILSETPLVNLSEFRPSDSLSYFSASPPSLLRPREVFNFVYSIKPKGGTTVPQGYTKIETPITIALASVPNTKKPFPEAHEATTSLVSRLKWKPTGLGRSGVALNFGGPKTVSPRARFLVDVVVENNTTSDMHAAQLLLQKNNFDLQGSNLIVPLRTGVALGRVPARSSTSLKLECVALDRGVASLGEVRVVVSAPESNTWIARNSFQVFVTDEGER